MLCIIHGEAKYRCQTNQQHLTKDGFEVYLLPLLGFIPDDMQSRRMTSEMSPVADYVILLFIQCPSYCQKSNVFYVKMRHRLTIT